VHRRVSQANAQANSSFTPAVRIRSRAQTVLSAQESAPLTTAKHNALVYNTIILKGRPRAALEKLPNSRQQAAVHPLTTTCSHHAIPRSSSVRALGCTSRVCTVVARATTEQHLKNSASKAVSFVLSRHNEPQPASTSTTLAQRTNCFCPASGTFQPEPTRLTKRFLTWRY
jgi:hypothetical protein